jgi:hypothetical protein
VEFVPAHLGGVDERFACRWTPFGASRNWRAAEPTMLASNGSCCQTVRAATVVPGGALLSVAPIHSSKRVDHLVRHVNPERPHWQTEHRERRHDPDPIWSNLDLDQAIALRATAFPATSQAVLGEGPSNPS